MTIDMILLILAIILIILILFREDILSLFESKPKHKKRSEENEEREETPQKSVPKSEYHSAEAAKKERAKREAHARDVAKQKAAKEAQAEKAAKSKAAAKRVADEKLANQKAQDKAQGAEQLKREAAKAKQKAAAEASAKKEAEEKAAAKKLAHEKAQKEAQKAEVPAKELPRGEYPDFSNSRLLDMGLSQTDADTFVQELVGQIDDHIPQIEEAINSKNYEEIERLTHSLKGSATNLGTGGVADLLIDYNTYCKAGKDDEILTAYLNILKTYQVKLKEQFG